MAFHRNVLQEDDILSKLYADTRSDVFDCSDNESSDSDSDVAASSHKDSDSDVAASSHKHLRSCVVVDSSDSESSTVEEECSKPENCDDNDVWHKTDKKRSNEPFLGTTGLNIVIHNPESVAEVVSSVIGDDLIQLRAD